MSMSRRFRKPAPFHRQSRRQQRAAYIELKNNICRASAVLGGLFHTHDYLHGKNGWADVYFLGRKAPLFYNAAMQTTRTAYKEAVWDAAWDGIGLHVTLDTPFLTIAAINSFIERFLSGESGYRAPQPCIYTRADIEHWGLESNALIEPWDWGDLAVEKENS